MKRLLTILTYLTLGTYTNAQTDTVLLSIRPRLISEYYIILKQNGIYIKENYTFFKGAYWPGKKDTVTLSGLTKTFSGYVELKKKNPLIYLQYGICDSMINKIRNNASYQQMQNEIDNIARSRIGYYNKAFHHLKEVNRPPSALFYKTCYADYQSTQSKLRQKYLVSIDSLYNDKVQRLNWIKSNQKSITQDYIDSFINSFNESDPDFRSLEIIIINHPELFLSSIYKLDPDTDFFSFILKLNKFPKDINLKAAKAALAQTKNYDKRKRKVIRKMKNNEG